MQGALRRDGFDASDPVERAVSIRAVVSVLAAVFVLGVGGALLVWDEIHAGGTAGGICGGTSGGAGRGGDTGEPGAVAGGAGERRAGGIGRVGAFDFAVVVVFAGHDGGAGIHRAGGVDLREMASVAGGGGVFVVRICGGDGIPAARDGEHPGAVHPDIAIRGDDAGAGGVCGKVEGAEGVGECFQKGLGEV